MSSIVYELNMHDDTFVVLFVACGCSDITNVTLNIIISSDGTKKCFKSYFCTL